MFRVNYVEEGFSVALDVLSQIEERLENPAPFLRTVGMLLEDSTVQRFADSEDPQGFSWENLAPLTRARKPSYKDKPLLTSNQGGLANSILHKLINNNQSLVVGSSSAYAVFHQSPQLPRNKIPRRAFLGISQQDSENILDALNRFLARS